MIVVMLYGSMVFVMPAKPGHAASSNETFEQKCAGCHTVGGGKLVGPDLEGVKDWDDAKLTSEVKRMQQMAGPLKDEEISSLVRFLKAAPDGIAAAADTTVSSDIAAINDTAASGPQVPAPSQVNKAPAGESFDLAAAPGSARRGRELFSGQAAFTNGGMSCISCHQTEGEGGNLGPDLHNIAGKMPATALIAACETTPYKIMKDAYAAHRVTKQEAIDLAKYFEALKGEPESKRAFPVVLAGLSGAFLLVLAIAWGYRNRNRSAREKLQRR